MQKRSLFKPRSLVYTVIASKQFTFLSSIFTETRILRFPAPVCRFKRPRLFPNLLGNHFAVLRVHSRRFSNCQQLFHSRISAVSIHRRAMLSEVGRAPRQIIRRRRMPAIHLFVIDPAEFFAWSSRLCAKTLKHIRLYICSKSSRLSRERIFVSFISV